MQIRFFLLFCAVLLAVLLRGAPVAAETLTCTDVASLPTTISTSGHYCLNSNFTQNFASTPITISADNVVLDCNDHVITHSVGSNTLTAVYGLNRAQVTVRNCVLVNFGRGVGLFETIAGKSRNNRVAGNDARKSHVAGIQVAGSANVVENNRISENLGSSSNAYTYGILMSSTGAVGVGNVVRNNVVTNIATNLYVRVIGIYLLDVQNTAVKSNVISGLFPPNDLGAYGIVGSPSTLGTVAADNIILAVTGSTPPGGGGGISYGGASYDGIRFDAATSTYNHNVCRGNTVGHFYTDITVESPAAGCVSDSNTTF